MRFAAGGAPVAVKRRVVSASSLLKKHPVLAVRLSNVGAWTSRNPIVSSRTVKGISLPLPLLLTEA
jgi:hypothetical protein